MRSSNETACDRHRQRLVRIAGERQPVVVQRASDQIKNAAVVIDDENVLHHVHPNLTRQDGAPKNEQTAKSAASRPPCAQGFAVLVVGGLW